MSRRVVAICVLGISAAFWYPALSAVCVGGIAIGWLGLPQPISAENFVDKIKDLVGA